MFKFITLKIPNPPLYQHTHTSYTSYTTVNLRVQIKTCPSNEQNITLLFECKGIDGSLSYNSDQETLLHVACRSGYSAMAAALLENGADVQAVDISGNNACHSACQNLHFNCLRLLEEHLNHLNADGDTALHILCGMEISKGKLPEFVKFIRETKELDINRFNAKRETPLHTACTWSNGDVVGALVPMKCNVNACDGLGNTALHIAVSSGNDSLLKVQCLLESEKCNPNVRNKHGHVPIHAVSRWGKIEVLEMLVTDKRCDVNIQDDNGNTPLHTAMYTQSGMQLRNVQLLLGCKRCDPNQQNANGDTALHIVSRMTLSLDTKLQYLQLFLSTPGINPEVLNNEHLTPFEATDKDGNTLLHNACAEGKSQMVQLLIENGADVLRPDRHGNAPTHIACMNFRLDILRILLTCKHCDPNQQNEDGDTALHIVCRMKIGNELEYLKLLLSVPGINPDVANHAGYTVIEVAGTNYAIIDALEKFLMHKRSSIQAYLKIFVVGNSGAGKSTLIKAVTIEASHLLKYSPFPRMKYVDPRDVPPRTAGIVPIPFNSKHFGNAVLYDFAGQHEYYSSHAAVMENLILPSPPLFLLLVDISKPMEEIEEELLYWWHFIDNQSRKATAPPHVLLGGSHKDIVKQQGRHQMHTIRMEIDTCVRDMKVSFTFAGLFLLDCRRLASQGLIKLLTQLQTSCKVLREAVDINLHCHILKAFLTTPVFQDKIYCRISDIVDQIETSGAYLPQSTHSLIPLLQALNDQGHILLLENHTDENQCWVILKPEVLLTDINGSIFAPEYFQKRSIYFAMSTGVGTLSKLKES